MGKHAERSKRHKKSKKKRYSSSSAEEWVEKEIDVCPSNEKRTKKRKKRKRKDSSSSEAEDRMSKKRHDTSSSSDEDNKKTRYQRKQDQSDSGSQNRNELCRVLPDGNDIKKRDDWMSLPTSFLTPSNSDRKRERDEEKRLEREKQQYNPRECTRELNPYWKNGGDGLPKFKKPEDFDNEYNQNDQKKERYSNKIPNWKKKKEIEQHHSFKSDKKEITESSGKSIQSGNSALEIQDEDNVLSDKELNVLAAKLVKAEIMGNTKLVNELKLKLEIARNSVCQSNTSVDVLKEEKILLTHTDSQGRSQPVKLQSEYGESSGNHKRKKNIETHKDGQRVRYFADDDKYSLKQMFENEKYNSVDDQNSEFVKMTSKIRKNDDLDDMFSDNIRKKKSDSKIDLRNRDRAINEQQKISKSLDNCNRCIQSELMLKHLMISMGDTSYLALPPYESLTESHCFIIPIRHVPCSTLLDENEWSDILDMRRSLVNMFRSKDQDVIFFETAKRLHRFPHMYIECIPLPKEDGDMAPIYFKKAIDESETEWAQNKKLISLKGRDIRKAVPKGLPYFSVSFGMEEGFAHVIEDEQMFPDNFAQEIIGGMLDLHHSKWRNPKKQNFDDQSKKVLKFSKEWKDFD